MVKLFMMVWVVLLGLLLVIINFSWCVLNVWVSRLFR